MKTEPSNDSSHSIEQQEWTVRLTEGLRRKLALLTGTKALLCAGQKIGEVHMQGVADAHNAELASVKFNTIAEDRALTHDTICDLQDKLAAEREKVTRLGIELLAIKTELNNEHTNAEAWRLTCKGKEGAYVEMEQQLAAERQRRKQAVNEMRHLVNVNLSAHAAIERVVRACDEELSLPYYKETNTSAVMGTFVALKQICENESRELLLKHDADLRAQWDKEHEQSK